ncbi:MAG: MBL fold metallo-hydrolase, partial [Proteobacteria bacterium]|nr:MBL fold metallo-hydrolase [Pseudomonadota bacterium]
MEEVSPGIRVVALPSPTLYPATHTNCYIIGNGLVSVVDPPSVETADVLAERLKKGERPQRVILTHHHLDHTGGAMVLRQSYSIPVVAHSATKSLLGGKVQIDEEVADGALLECGGRTMIARHTPGHAPGHLILLDQQTKALIAGDMVAGIGTVVIGAQHGDLGQYLASLDLMRNLKPSVLL